MDFLGDFFGTNPASHDEREAEKARLIREAELDHVIQNGKVYIEVDQVIAVYRQLARLLNMRALLTGNVLSHGAAGGMEVASNVLGNLSSELLRREAEAIVKAAEDGV